MTTAVLEFRAAQSDETPVKDATAFGGGPDAVRIIEVEGRRLKATISDEPYFDGGPSGMIELTACEDGKFLVVDPETATYGHGDSPNEAFDDFVYALVEYREVLAHEDAAHNLSDRLRSHLEFIDRILPPR